MPRIAAKSGNSLISPDNARDFRGRFAF